jgi:hypothetical protein
MSKSIGYNKHPAIHANPKGLKLVDLAFAKFTLIKRIWLYFVIFAFTLPTIDVNSIPFGNNDKMYCVTCLLLLTANNSSSPLYYFVIPSIECNTYVRNIRLKQQKSKTTITRVTSNRSC